MGRKNQEKGTSVNIKKGTQNKTTVTETSQSAVKKEIFAVENTTRHEISNDNYNKIKNKIKTPREQIYTTNNSNWARVQLKNNTFVLVNINNGKFSKDFSQIDKYEESANFAYGIRQEDGEKTLINLNSGKEIEYFLVSENESGEYQNRSYKIAHVNEANEDGWAVVDLTGTDGYGFINVKTGETSGRFKFVPQKSITKDGLVLVSNVSLNKMQIYKVYEEVLAKTKDGEVIECGNSSEINDEGWTTRIEKNGKNISTIFFNVYEGKRVVIPPTIKEVGTLKEDMLPIKFKNGWTLVNINKLINTNAETINDAIEENALSGRFHSQEQATVMSAYKKDIQNIGRLSELTQDENFNEMLGYMKSISSDKVYNLAKNATNSLKETFNALIVIKNRLEDNKKKKENQTNTTKERPAKKIEYLNSLYFNTPESESKIQDDVKVEEENITETTTKLSKREQKEKLKKEVESIMAKFAELEAFESKSSNDENV